MATYGAIIYFFLIPSGFGYKDESVPWLFVSMIFTSTALIPATALLFLWKLGTIKSVRIEDQKERNWPLLFGATIYFAAYYMLQKMPIPPFILLFLLGAILGILVSLAINLKWKISLHMIGIGGLCGATAIILFLQEAGSPLILTSLFFIAGLLGTARLYLEAHSPAQIFVGFLTGFSLQFILILFMLG
jgi:hypothetical protein